MLSTHRLLTFQRGGFPAPLFLQQGPKFEAGMRRLEVDHAFLITTKDNEEVETSAGTIRIVPAWRWLLGT